MNIKLELLKAEEEYQFIRDDSFCRIRSIRLHILSNLFTQNNVV